MSRRQLSSRHASRRHISRRGSVRRIRGRGRIASAIAAALAALLVAVFAIAPAGDTYAAFSDFGNVNGNSANADVWEVNPPAGSSGCGDLSKYTGVVYSSVAGAAVEAAAHTILIVSGEDTVVTADADTCIIVGVLGVHILNLDLSVHLVLSVSDTVCSVVHSVITSNPLSALLLTGVTQVVCTTVITLEAALGLLGGLGLLHANAKPAILPGVTDPTAPTTKDAPIIGRTDQTTPAADPSPNGGPPAQGTDPTHQADTTPAASPAKPMPPPSSETTSTATAPSDTAPSDTAPADTGAATQGDAPPATDPTSPSGAQ